MKMIKRILSVFLCSGMMLSSFDSRIIRAEEKNVPGSAENRVLYVPDDDPETEETAEGSRTVLAFTSDVHNKENNIAADRLSSWIGMVTEKYGRIDYMGLCGDMAQASAPEDLYWAYTQKVIDAVNEKGIPACYTTGNHEFKPGNFNLTKHPAKKYFTVGAEGGEGEDYYIYCLGTDKRDETKHYRSDQAEALVKNLKGLGNDRVIIVLTHFPLHSYSSTKKTRQTNNAGLIIDALNEVVTNGTADTSDDKTVILLWGHNHTLADTHYDNVYKPGNSLIYNLSENSREIKFYYASAGCMSDREYSSGSSRIKGKGLVITIKDNQPEFAYYDMNGNDVTKGINDPPTPVTVTGVSLDESNVTAETGSTVRLNAAAVPENASFKDIRWTSSDDTVAAVTDTGAVKCIAAGTAVIRAASAGNEEVFAECIVTVKDPLRPVISSVTNTGTAVEVTWNREKEAAKYRLFRKTRSSSWTELAVTSSTSYTDKAVQTGTTYAYRLVCLGSDGAVIGKYSASRSVRFLTVPVIKKTVNAADSVQLKWTRVKSAVRYRVYRKTGKGSWKRLTDTDALTYKDTAVKNGTAYSYRIRGLSSSGSAITSYSEVKNITFVKAPEVTERVNAVKGIRITWTEVKGAAKYQVYRKTRSGSWTLIRTTGKTAFTDKDVQNGIQYRYRIRSVAADSSVSVFSSVVNRTRVDRPEITGLTNSKAGRMTVKWSKVAKAKGYQIQYSASKTFASGNRTVLVKDAKTVSKVIASLTEGKTYYVRVRAYRKVAQKTVWSAWSEKKKIKIRK